MNTPSSTKHVVVVGAGQAGFQFCVTLREQDQNCEITLIGEEWEVPYERPPLSKGYLLGAVEKESLQFRPRSYYAENNIALLLQASCRSINPDDRRITLSDGTEIPYDTLVLATGASPVFLPENIGGKLGGVHYLRGLADADHLRGQLNPESRMIIVGGGYIGLEAAATASQLGLKAVLVEASPRILSRVASSQTSDYFRELHLRHGVDIREDVKLESFVGQDGHLSGARLSDGTTVLANLAVVGIGVRPCIELAVDAGLLVENGIAVDTHCRTSDQNIFAIGDCASFSHSKERVRLESVGNAIDMAQTAAKVVSGSADVYEPKPRFWSDQYDTTLQIAGLSHGFDHVVERKGGAASVSFWYYSGPRLLAADVVNDPRTYLVAKRLIEQGVSPSAEKVSDGTTNIKTLLKS